MSVAFPVWRVLTVLAAMPVWGLRGHRVRTVMAAWRGARVGVDWQPRVPRVLVRTVMAACLEPTPVPGTVKAAQVLVGSSDFHLANEAVHVRGYLLHTCGRI